MRKTSAALLVFLATTCAQADNAFVITPNSNITIQVSNESPNAIAVHDDRITVLQSNMGSITSKENTPNGAMVFSTTVEKPITFFVETEKGFFFSVLASPIAGPGRTYEVSNKLARGSAAAATWEKSLNYEEMLVELNKQLLNGLIPAGFVASKNFDYAPAGNASTFLKVIPLEAWVGDEVRVLKLTVRNTSPYDIELNGGMFWARGVRSVYIDRNMRSLGPEREATLMITLTTSRSDR
ncbi:type-F conjugative transfer system secretin TraK [Pseudomonas sp. P5_152]|uniref:TraK domain-containing protein n=1 Tax=Pseudomonas sp. P5_152 TaxID=3043442 RepID=UPI002A35F150|nr:type-F conjugative transfer system secretin TraK [Pseudomonas sp. P5_152]MDX9668649.1 type-F conjugative transfer system secretin TraK [Pseudomonas sp. P5_152]